MLLWGCRLQLVIEVTSWSLNVVRRIGDGHPCGRMALAVYRCRSGTQEDKDEDEETVGMWDAGKVFGSKKHGAKDRKRKDCQLRVRSRYSAFARSDWYSIRVFVQVRVVTYVPFSEGVPGILKLLGLSVASAPILLSSDGDIVLVDDFEISDHEVGFEHRKLGQHYEEFATGATAKMWHAMARMAHMQRQDPMEM